MDIQAINDIFKDITESITGLNGYAFGWPADRVRGRDPETDAEAEYPRLFFTVPTVQQDILRNQDIYNVTLYFDDLQGYDNSGDAVSSTQLGQWSALQLIAQKWLNEFKGRHYEREADYAGISSPVSITLDSFGGMQRMATVQMSFNLVTPSMCAITITLKVARMSATATATLLANAQVARIATASFSVNSTMTATAVKGGVVVIQTAESAASAEATFSARLQVAKQAESNASVTASVTATPQRAVIGQSSSIATATVTATVKRAQLAQLYAIAGATLEAIAVAEQKGVVSAYASLHAVADMTATAQLVRHAEMTASATATLSATAQRALVAEFTAEATAVLSATLAAIRVAQAEFTAVAETSMTAVVSKAISATMQAQAETAMTAQVSKAITASMTAQATTSILAVLANQVVFIASTESTVTAQLKRAKIPTLSASAAATVTATATQITPSASDPYWSNVTLLLRGNSAPITDEKVGYTFTTYGTTPTISTEVKMFGAGSMSFAGNGHISNTDYDDTFAGFGTGAFTIETWVRFNSVAPTQVVFGILTSGGDSTNGMVLYISADSTLKLFGPKVANSTTVSVSTNVWYHIAVTRSGNTWRLFKDGVAATTFTDIGSINSLGTKPFTIGGYGTTAYLNGYLDDFRITKGIARYTSNFTPPTAEFPNS